MTPARSPSQREKSVASPPFFFSLLSLSEGNPQQTAEMPKAVGKASKLQTAQQGSARPAAVAQNKINPAHPGQTPSVALYYQMI